MTMTMSCESKVVFQFLILVFFSVVFGEDEQVFFSNSWGVEVAGGPEVAIEIAKKHGFVNKGQVSFSN